MPTRRDILQFLGASAGAGLLAGALPAFAAAKGRAFASKRPAKSERRFVSAAVERQLSQIKARIGDPELAWLFENCYPNTLDTSVRTGARDG